MTDRKNEYRFGRLRPPNTSQLLVEWLEYILLRLKAATPRPVVAPAALVEAGGPGRGPIPVAKVIAGTLP